LVIETLAEANQRKSHFKIPRVIGFAANRVGAQIWASEPNRFFTPRLLLRPFLFCQLISIRQVRKMTGSSSSRVAQRDVANANRPCPEMDGRIITRAVKL